MRLQLLLTVFTAFVTVECSNILFIFYVPSRSHILLGEKLAEGLIKKGHQVTFASPTHGDRMENCTYITLKKIFDHKKHMDKLLTPDSNMIKMFLGMNRFTKESAKFFWEDEGIQKIIREKPKFDAIILVNFGRDSIFGLGHHLGAPIILFNTIGTSIMSNKYFGNPNMPYTKSGMIKLTTDTFLGRLATVTVSVIFKLASDFMNLSFEEELLQKYIPNAPSLQELKNDVSLMLLNSHVSIEPARPYLPNMIQIGGFHLQSPKELPKDIKKFLDDAEDGVIVFSMGSNVKVSTFGQEKIDVMMKVFGELAPTKVIFKTEMEHENLPKNLLASKWLPQSDILAHPNIRVFISHGGLGGNTESVYHGIPILGIPFMGEQRHNLMEAESAGYALRLELEDLTETLFREKLMELLRNPKYTANVKKRSGLMKEQPVQPLDNAIFWVEHIIKNKGGSHLRNAGMDLAWYQLYMIDIYLFYTVLLVVVSLIQFYTMKFSFRFVKKFFSKTNDKIKTS